MTKLCVLTRKINTHILIDRSRHQASLIFSVLTRFIANTPNRSGLARVNTATLRARIHVSEST